ncbi:hypothetical protein HDC90_004383 [Pedobacter sp. AK013]|nr:hypothetical protein [Pedobacter sp. AK013]
MCVSRYKSLAKACAYLKIIANVAVMGTIGPVLIKAAHFFGKQL